MFRPARDAPRGEPSGQEQGKYQLMTRIRRAAVTGLFAIWLAPLSAGAGSQSSNSSSDCSSGRGTRVESLMIEDRNGRRGWVRQATWRGRDGWGAALPEHPQPPGGREDDDD